MTRLKEVLIERWILFSAILSVIVTISVFGFMVVLGFPLFRELRAIYLLRQPWIPLQGTFGIYPMIVATLAISFMSIIFAFPVSLGCASVISVIGPRFFRLTLRKLVEIMTGIPTVIYGFVGVFLLVPLIREVFMEGSGMCMLTASLMLALLISPTIILFMSDSFSRVPQSYLYAVDSLGGNKIQKLLYVVLPYAKRGILVGLIIGFGRGIGDTLIALMLAGNATNLPGSFLESARTLTSHIALVIAADYESLEFKSIFLCGMVLYLLTMLITLTLRILGSKEKRANG